ncbi:LemA protein [Thermoanaerobacter uzonensis DSM 18761]|uniref:LemA protein n=1 Tax=Thermoanaerobacter uzonensis DSM 18761 TaxID=1123369 RepID=A0A1M4SUT2_9THEO|nr:LemA family protein [Thermoanaerobacter uzonensis]SHE35960.1 LemA protein [Thermoanaerobacter uzonensis DSM 18761]
MKNPLIITLVVLAVIAVLVFGTIYGTYNQLVALDENVNSKWSQIDNQLQRRADLIPNLVETVKGYATHEKEIFDSVNKAREKLLSANTVADKAASNEELNTALGRLLAIAENYPNLKADANFRQLSDELAGTENRIAVARMDYNNAVQAYNTKIRSFPTSIIANMFGFKEREYFKADETAKTVPKVDFSK